MRQRAAWRSCVFICVRPTERPFVGKDFAPQDGMIERHWRDRRPQQHDPVFSATSLQAGLQPQRFAAGGRGAPGLGEAIHPLASPSPGFTDAEAGDETGARSGGGVTLSG